MSEYKPITSELRNSMTYDITTAPNGVSTASIGIAEFNDLCDAIDSVHAALEAEHEKAMIRAGQLLDDAEKERDYNYANWQECKQKVLQGNITFEELERENESLKAELDRARGEWDYWENTHVELPKDSDGEPVRIGDVMENIVCPSVHREVTGVGVECFYGWDEGNGRYSQFSANCYRHYHAPTVEDVLREFANEVYADADNEIRDRDFLCAKYAKRLALAGDEQ